MVLWQRAFPSGLAQLRRYADRGLLVDLPSPHHVAIVYRALLRSHPDAVTQCGWRTILVGTNVARDAVIASVTAAMITASAAPAVFADQTLNDADRIPLVIDVVYDGQDLETIAQHLGCSTMEVVALHTAPTYAVAFLGFCRGFPYLAGLDARLVGVPRLSTPRLRVPAGSVAIANDQTGVYPIDTPGGWRILGHSTTVLFDPSISPPTALTVGSPVRFRSVQP